MVCKPLNYICFRDQKQEQVQSPAYLLITGLGGILTH